MEDGACTGCVRKRRRVTDVKAKAVITGGFLGNVDMMREFGTFVNPLGNVLSVGEGHRHGVQAAGGSASPRSGASRATSSLTGSNQKADGLYDPQRAPRSPSASTARC